MIQDHATARQSSSPPRQFNYLPLAHYWEIMPLHQRAGVCYSAGVPLAVSQQDWDVISIENKREIIASFKVSRALENFGHYCQMAEKAGYLA